MSAARADTLARLRARIAALEGTGEAGAVPLGVPEIDGALPRGGLARGALHEITGPGLEDGAAGGFCALLLSRFAGGPSSPPRRPRPSPREERGNARRLPSPAAPGDGGRDQKDGLSRPVLWVSRGNDLYAPGLRLFALDPARLLVVRAGRDAEALWAVEEGLRCPELAAVAGEVRNVDFTAGRRLQLAAARSGVAALLLCPARASPPASAAVTRWRVVSAPSGRAPFADGVGPARWRVALLRGRGARPGEWLLEWNDETGDLAVAAEAGDRQDREAAA